MCMVSWLNAYTDAKCRNTSSSGVTEGELNVENTETKKYILFYVILSVSSIIVFFKYFNEHSKCNSGCNQKLDFTVKNN